MKSHRFILILALGLAMFNLQAAMNVETNVEIAEANLDEPTMAPEEQPKYVGGDRALFDFFKKNLKEVNAEVTGKAVIRVIITETGKVRNARIIKSVGCHKCDQEALRVIYKMPDWTPAKVDGQNVASYYTIPVEYGG